MVMGESWVIGSNSYTDAETRMGMIETVLWYPDKPHICPGCDPLLDGVSDEQRAAIEARHPKLATWRKDDAKLVAAGDPPRCPRARGERLAPLTEVEIAAWKKRAAERDAAIEKMERAVRV